MSELNPGLGGDLGGDLSLQNINARVENAAKFFGSGGIVKCTGFIETQSLVKDDYCELWLKTENLQTTGSFKLRGAYYRMSLLTEE
ncbi:MAG: hypothetical protein FWD35_06730, partial [Oscillospiraceae bacterium]|nr:hypothetical protein [Oscillospiraceae bacterium]